MTTATSTLTPLPEAPSRASIVPPVPPNVTRLQGRILAALAGGPLREEVIVRTMVERHEYTSLESADLSEAFVELICSKRISWVDSGGWKAMV